MKGRVLIIDDNPTDLKVASMALERSGFECRAFTDAGEALAWTAENSCQLIFLDLEMPGIGGYAMITRFRAAPATASVPIVIISGKNQSEDVRKAIQLGANDYVIKPLDPMVLQEKAGRLNEAVGEFVGVDVPEGQLESVFFKGEAKIVGMSEFGLRVEAPRSVAPAETVEMGGLPKELVGSDRLLLRCLSSEKTPGKKTMTMQFTFVGISEAQRQLIRQLCRRFWVAMKGAA